MKPYPKYFDKIRIRPEKEAAAKPQTPICQWDGCDQAGIDNIPQYVVLLNGLVEEWITKRTND